MRVWRIAKSEQAGSVEDMLSGEGAARYGGRWTPKGVPAVYCSENSSLAALEILQVDGQQMGCVAGNRRLQDGPVLFDKCGGKPETTAVFTDLDARQQ